MTLVQTIISPFGVWACSDHRLTNTKTLSVEHDESVKELVFRCHDGWGLLTYTGLGAIGDDHVADWLRQVLRGESRTVNETLIAIREQGTRKLGSLSVRARVPHTFLIGAFVANVPWAVLISNAPERRDQPPLPNFDTAVRRVDTMMILAGGAREAVAPADRERLRELQRRAPRPRRPEEFLELLATINRRAARHPQLGHLISPACATTFVPASGEPIKGKTFRGTVRDRVRAPIKPHLFFGIDLVELTSPLIERGSDLMAGNITEEEFKRLAEEAGRRAVQPKQ